MDWPAISLQVSLLRLDIDVAEAQQLELETRATTADGRAEAAWARLLALAGR